MTIKTINLALQGGGAHGAFTWGVLDRLLEDERVRIEGISATSAGAVNAAVLVDGFIDKGAAGAREALAAFWRRVSDAVSLSPLRPTLLEEGADRFNLDWSPGYLFFDLLTRMFSPYQLNPFDWNPLQNVLKEMIDFERLRRHRAIKLFVCATNIETGKIKMFHPHELSVKALLASACLPSLQRTVEVDGGFYWDGGYMGNPAIFPLLDKCESRDIVIVQINPISRPGVPNSAQEILNRVNEISFNSSMMREMRAICFVNRLIEEGIIAPNRMKHILIHMIEAEELMAQLGCSSKLNTNWGFLTRLRDIGRERADDWLAKNFAKLGLQATVDVEQKFL